MCRAKYGGKPARVAPHSAPWQWPIGLTVIGLLLVANLAYLSGAVPPWAHVQAGPAASAAVASERTVGAAGEGPADRWHPHNLALSVDSGAAHHVTATATLDGLPLSQQQQQQQRGSGGTQAERDIAVGPGVFDKLPELRGVAIKKRRAIASIVPAIGDPHLAAVVTLAYSLRKAGNALPLVLFYVEGGGFSPVARRVAERAGWTMRPFERVEPFKKTQLKYTDAYTKLRMWDMADEYDQLLYVDHDTLATGRVEMALEFFARNGKRAPQPLGIVRNQRPRTHYFNTGVMAIQPDHEFFEAMMAAGRNKSFVRSYKPGLAEQAFLNAFLNTRGEEPVDPAPTRYSWVELPPTCNLMTGQHALFPAWFERQLATTLLLHYAGENRFMMDNVQFDSSQT